MIIKTYDELSQYVEAFNQGHINFLVVESRGGLGKSYTTRRALNSFKLIAGHTTPYSLFNTAKNNSTSTLLFDDVDALLDNKTNVALLKQITDTTTPKQVTWNTTRQVGGRRKESNQQFESHNRCVLLSNDVKESNNNLKALATRAVTIVFEPSRDEILQQAKQFVDDEIINHIECTEFVNNDLNFRLMKKAEQLKESGIDWIKYLNEELGSPRSLVKQLRKRQNREPELSTTQIIEEFKAKTGLSERTFYRYSK